MTETWTKRSTPVLSPTQSWEAAACQEPFVLYEDNLFKMWYTGGFANPAIGYATSSTGEPGTWVKHDGPILGHGVGGAMGIACHHGVVKHDGIYYLYYVDSVGPESISMYVATSPDGITFTAKGPAVLPYNAALDSAHANPFLWVEDGLWHMLYESRAAGNWKLFHATARHPLGPWVRDTRGWINSILINGSASSPWVIKNNGRYHAWIHANANLPTHIYHVHSADLWNWTNTGPAVLTNTLPFEVDQVADPSLVEVGGITFMFYDALNNPAEQSVIALATIEQPLNDIINGPPPPPPPPPGNPATHSGVFNGSNASLSRTFGGSGNRQKWTKSFWIKRASAGQELVNLTGMNYNNTGGACHSTEIRLWNDKLDINDVDIGLRLTTSGAFASTSQWYHVVLTYDSTQASPSQRVRLWVNNVAPAFATANYPGQNAASFWNSGAPHYIGKINIQTMGDVRFFPGLITEFNFIDGQALSPDQFGALNNGVWEPVSYAGTRGANGFYLKFADAQNLGADSVGSNGWVANNLTQSGVTPPN